MLIFTFKSVSSWTLRIAKIHPLVRDIAITSGTSLVIVVASPLVVSILAHSLHPDGLGQYLLLRRVAGWLWAGSLLGFGVGLPRYIAHERDQQNAAESYFLAGALCLMAFGLLLSVLLNSAPVLFSRLLFGDAAMVRLIVPLNGLVVALVVNTLVYGYYQGLLEMRSANALNFLSLGVVPLAAVSLVYTSGSVEAVIKAMAGGIAASGFIFAVPILLRCATISQPRVWLHMTQLLRFGVRRLPGDLAVNTLLVAGPIVASHYVSMPRVAALLLGISLLCFVELSIAPVGTVMLSKVSQMLAQGRSAEVAIAIGHWTIAVIEFAVFVCLQLVIFADVLVRVWVGVAMVREVNIIRIVLLSIPFDLLFIALRSSVDAATVKAFNAHNLLIALAVFATMSAGAIELLPVHVLAEAMAVSLLAAFSTLAILTVWSAHHLVGLRIQRRELASSLSAGTLAAAIALFVRWVRGFNGGVPEVLLVETVLTVTVLAGIRTLNPSWARFLRAFVLTSPSSRAVPEMASFAKV
jgi:O-antigen/teichoic acid export membrane protein